MNKNIELRLEYTQLVIDGKDSEAFEVLKEIWELDKKGVVEEKVTKKVEKIESDESNVEESKGDSNSDKDISLDDLGKIKGIGKKTIQDIKKIYKSISELKSALEEDNVPLRDDVVIKLKKELI